MPASRAKSLSSLFGTFIQTQSKSLKPSPTLATLEHQAPSPTKLEDSSLKLFVSSLNTPLRNSDEQFPVTNSHAASNLESRSTLASKWSACSDSDAESSEQSVERRIDLTKRISWILIGAENERSSDSEGSDDDDDDDDYDYDDLKLLPDELNIPWLPSFSQHIFSSRRKDVVRDRKLKWVFSSSQGGRFDKLVKLCAKKVGSNITFELFGKLGQGTGVKEYKALINICVELARNGDEEVALEQIHRAFLYFSSMKEYGYELEDDVFGSFMTYLIDMVMVDEFYFFCEVIQGVSPSASAKLGYYEMTLWIKIDDEEKIKELCDYIITDECGEEPGLRENYLLALCEGGRERELMQLLEIIDVTKFRSKEGIEAIFSSLGQLQLEVLVDKFLSAFRAHDFGIKDLSYFLFCYAVGNPNLSVEDVVGTFSDLHAKHEVKPSCQSFENLLKHCCKSLEVDTALDLVEEMYEAGLTLSVGALNHILQTCEETFNHNLVHRVSSMLRDHSLAANHETFSKMISLCVNIKDMGAAQRLLSDMGKWKLAPTSRIFNTLMVGCFREKNSLGALKILKAMEDANIKPDSRTFSYLINNSASEEDIDKYFEELKRSGLQATKTIYMALIHAYAACGLFEKAKQVISDKWLPVKNMNEIRSTLVQALATHGQLSDALELYEEIKRDGFSLEPKAAISIIEYYNSDGGSSTLLRVLGELTDPEYWLDGCSRIIYYCIHHNDLSPAIELLKQLKEKLYEDHELVLESILDEVFCVIGDLEPINLQMGLELLRVIKYELGLTPPRKCLDFLLHACVVAKDLESSRLIWKEYREAGHPYNILSFLRMYQALLASGDKKAAKLLLKKIPRDDPHVRYIIQECQNTYADSVILEKKKRTKKDRS